MNRRYELPTLYVAPDGVRWGDGPLEPWVPKVEFHRFVSGKSVAYVETDWTPVDLEVSDHITFTAEPWSRVDRFRHAAARPFQWLADAVRGDRLWTQEDD